nr:hypothetical transcript [Hymenolepis microstoma]
MGSDSDKENFCVPMPHQNIDHSRSASSSHVKALESSSTRRFSSHHIYHHPTPSIVSASSDVGIDSISSTSPLHQSIGLRTKKYLIPRLLSNRKLALSVLHPLSASLMNDIHYLLKAHITPKDHFHKVDQIILRTIIKVGIVSQRLLDQQSAVGLMRRVERQSRHFGLIYCELVTQADEGISPSPSSSSSNSPAKTPTPDLSILLSTLKKLQDSLNTLIQGQLSDRSINQMNEVFEEIQDPSFWNRILDRANSTPQEWSLAVRLRDSFQNIIEAKLL